MPPNEAFLNEDLWGKGLIIDDIPRLANIVKPSIISLNPCLTSISKSTRKKKIHNKLIMKGSMHIENSYHKMLVNKETC